MGSIMGSQKIMGSDYGSNISVVSLHDADILRINLMMIEGIWRHYCGF
jgi:hypothetical protein